MPCRSSEKLSYVGLRVFTGLVLLFLIAPILAIMPLSFNAEPYFSYPMPGLSLQWYRRFLRQCPLDAARCC